MKLYPYIIFLLIFSCAFNEKKDDDTTAKTVINEALEKPISYCYDSIQGIKGFIVNNPDIDISENLKLNIYALDGTILSSVQMDNEYQPIIFRCSDFNEEFFSIVIDGTKKYLKRNDKRIIFQTWENHILDGVFAINFDVKSNPIKKSIEGEKLVTQLSNNRRITPLEIDGNYLMVKYEDFNTSQTLTGWIQWRNSYCLLIELLYFA